MERFVDDDPAAAAHLTRLGARGVPTFLVGDEVIVGLDTRRLEALIDFTLIPCPACPKRLRLPKGKGRLKVTCPDCRATFEATT